MDDLFELDRILGVTGDILYITDIDNQEQLQRNTIYGFMSSLQPIVHSSFSLFSKTYRIEEYPS